MPDLHMNWAPIPHAECNLAATLHSGQTFRWKRVPPNGWVGSAGSTAVRLTRHADGFWWQTYPEPDQWDVVSSYFRLEVSYQALMEEWRRAEIPVEAAQCFERWRGLRILRQPAEEAFFSFLCASCNTVVKITRSVNLLADQYGSMLAWIDGQPVYQFPAAWQIAAIPESDLRRDLWGYRAPRLIQLARHVADAGENWLESLRPVGYPAAREALDQLPGIGLKIADCICLFGLGFDQAVPVDTHVRQIALDYFRTDLSGKSLTPRVYEEISQTYRDLFGEYAGWAQQALFVDRLDRYGRLFETCRPILE